MFVDLSTLANVVTNLASLSKDRDDSSHVLSNNNRLLDPAARAFDTMARVVQGQSLKQLVSIFDDIRCSCLVKKKSVHATFFFRKFVTFY